jgi:outer membrane protein OmpA-like peptidoglycan-associated protein
MKFIRFLILPVLLIFSALFYAVSSSYADLSVFTPYSKYYRLNYEDMEEGTIKIRGTFIFDGVFNKLGDNWAVRRDLSGLNKYFSYKPSSNIRNKWEDSYGQTFLLNMAVKPTDWFFAEFGFEMINDYADRYWIPVSQEHRASHNGERAPLFDWTSARIGITTDRFSLVYHRNYMHNGWEREDDMFQMLLKQDTPDDYIRYSGHHTPDYWQFKTAGAFGDVDVMVGEEVIQDYMRGAYIKYKNIFGSGINFYYSDHVIPYGNSDERMRNLQVNRSFNFWGDSSVRAGLLFRPFRIGEEYLYSEKTDYPKGYGGSAYDFYSDETNYFVDEKNNAFGGALKVTFPKKLWFDLVTIGGDYRGLVAGNRYKTDVSVEKKLSNHSNAFLSYYYQKPLVEAMPLIYSASNLNGWTPLLSSARGPSSPFWVWWRNLNSGFDNRETSAFSFVYTYDPTPSTWFYMFDPNKPAESNLNPEEDAPFSFVVQANAVQYFGKLDRQSFWEWDGSTVWEDAYSNGTSAPNRYIGSLYFLSQIIKNRTKILFDFEIGEDLATLSYAYPNDGSGAPREAFTTPMIGYFKTSLTVKHNPYIFKTAYMKNVWGPEDWHRNFGSTFDEVYLAHISRDIGDIFNVGMEYVGARKNDSKVLHNPGFADHETSNETGSFDEIRVYLRILFDIVVRFADESELPFKVEEDRIPPEVALKVNPDIIYSDKGEIASFEPWVSDPSGIDKWSVTIKDVHGKTIKTFEASGHPPEVLDWGARDEVGNIVPNGQYDAVLEAYDNYGNYAITELCRVTVLTTPKDKEVKVKETERGLEISISAKVLFDTAKYNIKAGAAKTLKEVADLLNIYLGNGILIEGHTDSRGGLMYNQTLSENRANSVRKFFIKEGVDEKRMRIEGFGKLRPVSTNATAAGREQNRRVEIIILKEDEFKQNQVAQEAEE